MDSLIDSITELVLQELGSRTSPPPAQTSGRRVLLCPAPGSQAGEPVWQSLRALSGVAWQVLTWDRFTPAMAEHRLSGRSWRPVSGCPDELVQKVEAVVLPALTLDLLPRLAILLGDLPPVRAAVSGLVHGVPVLAAPEEVDRFRRHAARLPAGLVNVVSGHLRALESMGVRLLEGQALARELETPGARAGAPARGRDVITREDVIAALRSGSKVFEVASGSIVTPLALEVARQNGIEVRIR